MNNKVYSAEKGGGAYRDKTKLWVSSNSNLEESVLVTGFPYDIKENPGNAIEIFTTFLRKARAIRRLGSAAIDFCYVASGVFDAFWEVHLNPWDVCAGKLLVEEAGGIVTNFKNESIDIYSKQFLASNVKVHEEMVKTLNSIKN
jgi:myo-inositol-1(or 4)-monophosphatase